MVDPLSVIVGTFSAVYNLEKARRSNDQKIKTIFVEMKKMVTILKRLVHVQNQSQSFLN